MLDAIVYVAFAAIEVFSIMFLIMAIARMNIFEYIKESTVGVVIVSICTYLFKESSVLSQISPMICLLLFLSILILIFRISTIHSIIIVLIGYITCLIIQGVFIFIPTIFSSLTFEEIKSNDVLRYSFQTFNAIIIFIMGSLFRKKNIGFLFVPYSPSLRFKITKTNLNIVYLLILAVLALSSILEVSRMLIGIFMLIILFIFALFMGLRRERGEVKFD
ncbi:hypothetical protein [Paenibacillus tianjinensis]|uniref:Uncharacterized protein n=1 Tax=Paenibacillus tianjinensis TaxID=2810347 RepID=A0ABX7L5S2_9BACL|nr:hypothetical protein [Paenibacillus tianjinensis]QSF43470.1 hypothetical protein JRJ22_19595 [Paenibacillus tianjinensis]